MLVSEAVTLLKNTELKQLSVANEPETVLGYINLAILEIYKRFSLWQDEATITIVDGTLLYTLDGNDSNVSIDLSDHNMLMTEKVLLNGTEIYEKDTKLVINDYTNNDSSVFIPQYHQIKILTPVEDETPYIVGDTLKVLYRAAPIFLVSETQAIPLASQFFEALFNYVGHKGHGSIKTSPDSDDNMYLKRFEVSIKRISMNGLVAQDDLTSEKFDNNVYP